MSVLAHAESAHADDAWLDERGYSKLVWRCRRGLLENDLFLERFFKARQSRIRVSEAQALLALMDLSDNDLLDLLLQKAQPSPDLASDQVKSVLRQLQTPTPSPSPPQPIAA